MLGFAFMKKTLVVAAAASQVNGHLTLTTEQARVKEIVGVFSEWKGGNGDE